MKIFTFKNHLVFQFPFSYQLKDLVKGLFPQRMQFNKIEAYPNHWSVPLLFVSSSKENCEKLVNFCRTYGFSLDDDLSAKIKETNELKNTLLQLSDAQESNFWVDGLLLKLRPYQLAGVEYMVKSQRCLNSDDLRLGKSGQSLAAVHHQNAYPCLILCKSGLKYNWKNEIQKFLGEKDVYLWNKTDKFPESGKDFVIVNPEKLSVSSFVKDEYGNKVKDKSKLQDFIIRYNFKSIIFDEVHNVGQKDTARFQVIKKIVTKIPVRYGLSATPIKSRCLELCNILTFLGRLSEFGGKTKFIEDYYEVTHNGFGRVLGDAKDLDRLHASLKSICMVRRTKKDVIKEISPKEFISIEVPISNRRDYDRLAGDKNEIFKLRKVLGIGKVEAVTEWIEDFLSSGEPLILFAHHIEVQHAFLNKFPDAARLIAEDSLQVREENKKLFQDGKKKLLISSLVIGGEGHDLSAANNMAICELGWTPVQMEQAIGRMEAVGKTDPLTIYTFLGENTIDTKMAGMLQTKGAEGDMVVSGKVFEDSYSQTLLENL